MSVTSQTALSKGITGTRSNYIPYWGAFVTICGTRAPRTVGVPAETSLEVARIVLATWWTAFSLDMVGNVTEGSRLPVMVRPAVIDSRTKTTTDHDKDRRKLSLPAAGNAERYYRNSHTPRVLPKLVSSTSTRAMGRGEFAFRHRIYTDLELVRSDHHF